MEDHDTMSRMMPETPVSPPLQIRDELAEQKKKYDDLNDRYLRLAADFDNLPEADCP